MPFYPYAVLQNYGFGNKYHNAVRTIHAASTMPKYSNFRKDYARMASYVKPVPGSTSGNALAIRSLQRQLNKQKPELQHWFNTVPFNVSPTALTTNNFGPCDTLAAASDRDQRVLGDSWVNKSLEIRVNSQDTEFGFPGKVRLIVYIPKKAGTSISFGSINSCLDTNQMTVLHDELVKPYHQGNTDGQSTGTYCPVWMFSRRVSLGNRISTFIGTTPEKNNVRIALLTDGNSTSGIPLAWTMNYKLTYTNK